MHFLIQNPQIPVYYTSASSRCCVWLDWLHGRFCIWESFSNQRSLLSKLTDQVIKDSRKGRNIFSKLCFFNVNYLTEFYCYFRLKILLPATVVHDFLDNLLYHWQEFKSYWTVLRPRSSCFVLYIRQIRTDLLIYWTPNDKSIEVSKVEWRVTSFSLNYMQSSTSWMLLQIHFCLYWQCVLKRLSWLEYHQLFGVVNWYLLYEGGLVHRLQIYSLLLLIFNN